MIYLASSVTMPLPLAALLLILCVGEAIVIFYLLGSKKQLSDTGVTDAASADASGASEEHAADEEDLAVIISVLCEELNARPEELAFKEIKRIA